MQKILLIEDDPDITKLISLHLDDSQYMLTCCKSGEEAIINLDSNNYNLLMLDIGLPDVNGMELCKQIRQRDSHTPVMMITCHSEESDKVLALELGADDYVTKPFGILELLARIKAIIRRSVLPEHSEPGFVRYNELFIDSGKRKATKGTTRLDLTVKEFDLLWLLASNPGKIFTRKDLLEKIWGFSFSGYEHAVTSHINRLRLKLENNLNQPAYILTAWGSGYRFAE
ncbi:MAG: response regulator transcription factor [Ferruginibacter sp.]